MTERESAIAARTRGEQSVNEWTPKQWEEWSNEIAMVLPERYDGEEAQEDIILRAVNDLVERESSIAARARAEGMRKAFQITASALREFGDGPVSLAKSLEAYHCDRAELERPTPEPTPDVRIPADHE